MFTYASTGGARPAHALLCLSPYMSSPRYMAVGDRVIAWAEDPNSMNLTFY